MALWFIDLPVYLCVLRCISIFSRVGKCDLPCFKNCMLCRNVFWFCFVFCPEEQLNETNEVSKRKCKHIMFPSW